MTDFTVSISEKDYGPLIDEKERADKREFLIKWMRAMDRLEDPCKPIKEPKNENEFIESLCANVGNEMIKMEQEPECIIN